MGGGGTQTAAGGLMGGEGDTLGNESVFQLRGCVVEGGIYVCGC